MKHQNLIIIALLGIIAGACLSIAIRVNRPHPKPELHRR